MSDNDQLASEGDWMPATELPFYDGIETTRYIFGEKWLEVENNGDGTYLLDSNLLEEELGFQTSDELLDWVKAHGLLEVLTNASRGG